MPPWREVSTGADLIYFQWFGAIEALAIHMLGTDMN
jgi:hypothetical protein